MTNEDIRQSTAKFMGVTVPDKCARHHNVSKHFQQVDPNTVEATCRCETCLLEWQEHYTFDYSDE